jgi:PAS domain S-box-containing protein
MLRNYVIFLREKHLEELAVEYLRCSREFNVPLLKFFNHLSEPEIYQAALETMDALLASLATDRALIAAAEHLRAWEDDKMPHGITKAGLEPGDHVLVFAAQKHALSTFIDRFTDQVSVAKVLLAQLDEYFFRVQFDAVALFVELRNEAAERIRMLNSALMVETAFVENIFKHVPAGILFVDTQCVVRWVNPELAGLLQKGAEDIINRPFCECVPSPLKQVFESLLRQAFETGEVARCKEYRAPALLGDRPKTRHWDITFVPVCGQSRAIEGVLAFSQDVSDRVAIGQLQRDQIEHLQQLNAIRKRSDEQHRIFELLVESVEEYAIVTLDAGGYLQTWNKGAERIKGYSESEALGKHYAHFFSQEEGEAGTPQSLLARALCEGHVEAEGWRVRKDGTRFWADELITAQRDDSGQLARFVLVTRDVTERRRASEAIRQLNESLVAANKHKDQFLNIMSHELRTPITAIIGYGSLLHEELIGPLNAEQRDCTVQLMAAADSLLGLMNDLLDVTRILAGKLELAARLIEVAPVVEDVLANFKEAATRHGINLINKVPADLPPIEADEQRLAQILVILVGNALKFTQKHGWIEVRAAVEGQFIRLEVEDNGPGIKVEEQRKLFQTFSQVDMTDTREAGGIGLGLNICKSLVELHGGEIGLRSHQGKGCTFWLKLPLPHTR